MLIRSCIVSEQSLLCPFLADTTNINIYFPGLVEDNLISKMSRCTFLSKKICSTTLPNVVEVQCYFWWNVAALTPLLQNLCCLFWAFTITGIRTGGGDSHASIYLRSKASRRLSYPNTKRFFLPSFWICNLGTWMCVAITTYSNPNCLSKTAKQSPPKISHKTLTLCPTQKRVKFIQMDFLNLGSPQTCTSLLWKVFNYF